jgi:hypothetical protein
VNQPLKVDLTIPKTQHYSNYSNFQIHFGSSSPQNSYLFAPAEMIPPMGKEVIMRKVEVLITGGKVEWRINKKGRAISDPALVPRAI